MLMHLNLGGGKAGSFVAEILYANPFRLFLGSKILLILCCFLHQIS